MQKENCKPQSSCYRA